jgi:glycerophosphoryl diester phosphodiesterase
MITDKLIAHRGWQKKFPENTLIALEKAIDAGAKHIEIDIQLTKDLVPILCHDQQLQRLTGETLDLHKIDYEQTKKLSPYEPSRLKEIFNGVDFCTLQQCIDLIKANPDVNLYVELKRASIRTFGAEKFLTAILEPLNSISNQATLISFDIDILLLAKEKNWELTAPVLIDWQQLSSNKLQSLDPNYVFCDAEKIPEQQSLSNTPYPLAIYEIDDYQQAVELLSKGAALIETFDIGKLIQIDKTERENDE